jgi:hypothetical protein
MFYDLSIVPGAEDQAFYMWAFGGHSKSKHRRRKQV